MADRIASVGQWRTGRGELRVHEVLELGRHAEATEPLGEVHPREALVVLRAEHFGGLGGAGRELGEQLVAPVAHPLLVSDYVSTHKALPVETCQLVQT